jgi:hypothetical protein
MAISNAVTLANIGSQDTLVVDSVNNRVGVGSTIPTQALDVNGVVVATAFTGDGAGLTGVANTDRINTESIVVSGIATFQSNVSIAGTLTYEDVTNIDSVGLITARTGVRVLAGGVVIAGVSTFNDDIKGDTATNISGINSVTASSFYGDGSQLSGVVSGIELEQAGSSVGTSITAINFASGATLTTASAGISTVTIVAPSISTTTSSPTANTVVTLDLSSAQHHELTLSAGITTITCSGGSFGDSHSVVLIQPSSGITTVGLSTYFLFPSGSSPSFSEGSSQIDLLSFVVKRVGAAGTQLLTSAGLNYL